MPKVWANLKFMIMKKLAALLFFAMSTVACTTDDNETTSESNAVELNDANGNTTPPPTHDKDWNKNGIKI